MASSISTLLFSDLPRCLSGKANVTAREGSDVWGVVCAVSSTHKKKLDKGTGCDRIHSGSLSVLYSNRRTPVPQRGLSSFRHRARSWPRQRRICCKAEHSAAGTNLRFVVTNCAGRASQVFAFYNYRGECENRIEEFKNGFRADRLSCHRFLANAFRLLLHGAAHNLVNFFRHQLPSPSKGKRCPAAVIACMWSRSELVN